MTPGKAADAAAAHPPRRHIPVGLLVPFTNTNLEADMARLAPPGIGFHSARLGGYDVDEIPDERQMAGLGADDISEPLRLIQGVRPAMVLYGCTSATLVHGPRFDADLARRIAARSAAETVTAAGALVAALRALGVRRVGFASPYVGAINDLAVAYLEEMEVETVSRADIGRDLGNYGQGELTPAEVEALAVRADSPDAEALVLSCTDMRSVEAVEALETRLGKPVVTSNQAMLFAVLSRLGVPPGPVPCGRLLAPDGPLAKKTLA